MSALVVRPTFGKPAVTTDEYFGGCPECGKSDGFVDVGADHHFCCDNHRTRWYAGSNLFSGWRQTKSPEQVAYTAKVMTYREVEPVLPDNGLNRPPDRDGDLLRLCHSLDELRAEWQRLWDACPEDGRDCPENEAHDAYAAGVWPGQGEPLLKLRDMHATTAEGCQQKAAAVLAAYEASSYTNAVHDDLCELMASALRDAAGAARLQVGTGHA